MRSVVRALVPVVMVAALSAAAACGGDSPTEPGGSSASSQPFIKTYVGAVSLPGGVQGVVTVSTGTATALLGRPPGGLVKWLELIEPRLIAQSGTATGALTLSNSPSVILSGTYGGGSVQLSGSGGYNLNASISGSSSLSGTMATPFGTGTVAPMSSSVPSVPPPSNPNGEYVGTYSMTVNGYYQNVTLATGAFTRNCRRTFVITGTLTMVIDPGNRVAMSDQWREASTIIAPCPDVTDFSENILTPPPGSDSGGNFTADLANLQLSDIDQFQNNGGNGTRTMTFIGGFTNATTLQGRFVKTFSFSSLVINGTNEHRDGYPPTETTVTLVKR